VELFTPSSLGLVIGGYLAGSIPVGVLVTRRVGVDIRQVGSGNVGATNVARVDKKLGALVLLLDALKGALPVLAVAELGRRGLVPASLAPTVGLFAVVGHCFSVWQRLGGGKGVATALGVFAVLDPLATAIAVLVFAAAVAATRMASVGSLLGAALVPVLMWLRDAPTSSVVAALCTSVLIAVRHRDNVRRLIRGEEREL
jgi:glycerol-3-phosphate acyltransferase PlsY